LKIFLVILFVVYETILSDHDNQLNRFIRSFIMPLDSLSCLIETKNITNRTNIVWLDFHLC